MILLQAQKGQHGQFLIFVAPQSNQARVSKGKVKRSYLILDQVLTGKHSAILDLIFFTIAIIHIPPILKIEGALREDS